MPRFYEPEVIRRVQLTEMEILKDFMKICDEHHLRYFAVAGTGIGAMRHGGFIPWDDDIDIALPREDFERALQLVREKLSDRYYILNTEEDPNYPLMSTRLCKRGTKFQEYALQGVDCEFGIFLDLYAYDNVADGKFAYFVQAWTAWFWSKLLILRSIPHPYLGFTGGKAKAAQAVCGLVHRLMKWFHISPKWIYRKCIRQCKKYNHVHTKRMGYLCDTSPHWNTMEKDKTFPLEKHSFEDVQLNFPKDIHGMLVNFYGDYMQMSPVEKRKTHYPYVLDFGDGINVAK